MGNDISGVLALAPSIRCGPVSDQERNLVDRGLSGWSRLLFYAARETANASEPQVVVNHFLGGVWRYNACPSASRLFCVDTLGQALSGPDDNRVPPFRI